MNKKFAYAIVVVSSFVAAPFAHAETCAASPAEVAAVSSQLTQIADLSGEARVAALDSFVQSAAGGGGGGGGGGAGGSCISVVAISQAALLYPNIEDQKRVVQIAAAVGAKAGIETASIATLMVPGLVAPPSVGPAPSLAKLVQSVPAVPVKTTLVATNAIAAPPAVTTATAARPGISTRPTTFGGVKASAN